MIDYNSGEIIRRGRIEVICGSMFSGKTEELIDAHRQLLNAIKAGNTHDLSNKVKETYFEMELQDKDK